MYSIEGYSLHNKYKQEEEEEEEEEVVEKAKNNNEKLRIKNTQKKRSKMEEVTNDYYKEVAAEDFNALPFYQCQICFKSFSKVRGVQTHVYMQHILLNPGNSNNTTEAVQQFDYKFECLPCDKQFPNEEAFIQHNKAKHHFRDTLHHHNSNNSNNSNSNNNKNDKNDTVYDGKIHKTL